MKLEIKQVERELFSGKCEILNNGSVVGYMTFEPIKTGVGVLFELEHGKCSIDYLNKHIDIVLKRKALKKRMDALLPYDIIASDSIGEIFTATQKTGFLKSYPYHYMNIDGIEFTDYGIGFGNISKMPIYKENEQIGLSIKEHIVKNDMHQFTLLATNEDNIMPCLVMIAYRYCKIIKIGTKMSDSTFTYSATTIEKELIGKYNPEFEQKFV